MATGGKFRRSQIDASDAIYDFSCNLCAKDGKNTEALFKCVDCQTLYCQSCVTGHNKFTNNHNVVDKSFILFGQDQVNHARSMSSSELPVDLCEEHHGEVIKMYCGQHDLVCCTVCIAVNHRGCEGVEYIPNVAKGLLKRQDNVTTKRSLGNVRDGLQKLKSEMQKELKALDKGRDGVLDEIQKLKKRLIERIEELEKKSVKEAMDKHKEIATDINERSKKIDDMLKDIDMRLNKLEYSDATNEAQTFVDIKNGERAVSDGKYCVRQVSTRQEKAIKFELDRGIENFLRDAKCLAKLTLQNVADSRAGLGTQTSTGTSSLFGQATSQPSTGGRLFGQSKPLFGNTTTTTQSGFGFGTNTSTWTGGIFGQTQQSKTAASTGFGGFGTSQPGGLFANKPAFGAQTTSTSGFEGFGTHSNTGTNLFAKPFSTPNTGFP